MANKVYRNILPLLTSVCLSLLVSCTASSDPQTQDIVQAEADSLSQAMYDAYDAFDFPATVEVGQMALQKYEALRDTDNMCDVMGTVSVAYMRLGNVAEGLKMCERTIRLDSIKGDPALLSVDYNTMAAMYITEDKCKEAEPLVLKAIEYELQSPEQQNLSNRYGIASEVYCKISRPELAIDYAQKGLSVAEERQDTVQIGKRLSQLGQAYIAAGMLEDAEAVLKDCAVILEQKHSDLSLAITYRQLGNIYENRQQVAAAIDYYERAMHLARKINYTMLLSQCTQAIGELTAETRPEYAIQMLRESRALADTLHSHKVEELMADFATRFDLNEKQYTIEQQAAELKMHRMLLLIIGIAFAALVVVMLFVIYTKRMRRSNEQLHARYSEKVVEQTQHQELPLSLADREFVEKLATYVEGHLEESDLSSTSIADAFCLSPRQFSRRVKQLTGIDTTHYIRASRIVRARKMLTETNLSIQEIYVRCGFESANYFARIFRADVGVSPSEYRKNPTL